jgi:hypothetical protein
MSGNKELNQMDIDTEIILKELEKYKELNSYVGIKRLYKNTKIKKSRLLYILKNTDKIKEFSYSHVGSGIADKKLWKLE